MSREIEKGMWAVDSEGRVGVVFQADRKDDKLGKVRWMEFHLVDDSGATIMVLGSERAPYPVTTLRQASLAEIPGARRPVAEAGARLGYV